MSEKKRINEIAKETGFTNQELVSKAQELGFNVKSHSSSIDDSETKKLLAALKSKSATPAVEEKKAMVKKADSPAKKEKEKEVAPTFQGKAVVIDEAILARARAKEQEGKATKEESKPEVVKLMPEIKKVEIKKVEQAAVKPAPKIDEKIDTQSTKKPEVSKNKPAANKDLVHEKAVEKKTEPKKSPSAAPVKKKLEVVLPKVNIKVVKKAEFTEKPATSNSRGGHNNNNRHSNSTNTKNRDNRQRPQGQGQQGHSDKKPTSGVQKRVFSDASPLPTRNNRRNGNNNGRTQQRGGDSKYNDGNRAGGPLHVNDNRNQVRNARNSNWNNGRRGKKQHVEQHVERKFIELPETFEYTEGMTIADIAKFLHREPAEFIKILFMLGVMATQNTSLDDESIELLLMELGVTPEKKVVEDKSDIERLFVEEDYLNEENMVPRPPVVTIMGHVDHGKTTLLDHLRHSHVTEGEAGGITQAIGAYQLTTNGKKITFLDTPGHEAFTSMRARGASVTDITVLVVAADDGVMPQTIEAIDHSKAAGVPIIVAINKIDKAGANPQRVTQELAEHGVISQAWGGDSEFVEISAKFDKNIDTLLDTILLVAEMQELKADPTVRAIGTVIEARLDKGKGAIATLLVQQGTLYKQNPIVVGNTFGRVRAMIDDRGHSLKEAKPSTAVEITGLNDVPQAGDHFAVFEDEKSARAAGEERFKRAQLVQRQNTRRVSLENLFDTIKEGQIKTISIIIKADVQGSSEALAASLQKIEVEGVKIDIVHNAVGAINESDVSLADASNAIIIGFNVRPTARAREEATREKVEIRLHSIIYNVIEEMEEAMKGMLDPEFEEEVIGEAMVQETFMVSKVGNIAGFLVTSGKVLRDASVRVIRDDVVIHDGAIASLHHLKDEVKEVGNAQEGGLMIDGFNDITMGDTLEIYHMVELKH